MYGTMLVCIVILLLWISLISLILHDATKGDSNGSAVVLAAGKIGRWIGRKAARSGRAAGHQDAKKASLQPSLRVLEPAKVVEPAKILEPAANTVSSSSEAAPQEEPGAEKQTLGRPKKKKWWSKDSRTEITGAELEAAILEAVRKTASCQDFIGVIVGRKTPKSHLDPNWEVQGAKFGKADRKLVEEALASVVQRMQKELVLAEEADATPRRVVGRVML
jgi:hypothetical protein